MGLDSSERGSQSKEIKQDEVYLSRLRTERIDDLRVYNYALTAAQIQTLYNENAAVRFGPLTGSPYSKSPILF